MKNYIQPGHTITLTAPAAVTSGAGMLVGAIFGIAAHDAASGEPVEALTVGVIDINKVGTQAWAVGDKVYWDNTNKRATKTATDNTLIGAALGAVGSGADETTGRIRLNGCF
jgi:predicted RecA/RadA family phage recombinase